MLNVKGSKLQSLVHDWHSSLWTLMINKWLCKEIEDKASIGSMTDQLAVVPASFIKDKPVRVIKPCVWARRVNCEFSDYSLYLSTCFPATAYFDPGPLLRVPWFFASRLFASSSQRLIWYWRGRQTNRTFQWGFSNRCVGLTTPRAAIEELFEYFLIVFYLGEMSRCEKSLHPSQEKGPHV